MIAQNTVLALCGLAGSGKDTAADILATHCHFYKIAFADQLRHEIAEAFCIEPLYLTRRETKEHPMSALSLRMCRADGFVGRMMIDANERGQSLDWDQPRSPRQIMQWWGTEYRRRQDPDYWIKKASAHISFLFHKQLANRVVITDCRFENEADMVRRYGGQLWQVWRPGTAPAGVHASETSGAGFSPERVIDNSGDLPAFRNQVLGAFWAFDSGIEKLTVEAV